MWPCDGVEDDALCFRKGTDVGACGLAEDVCAEGHLCGVHPLCERDTDGAKGRVSARTFTRRRDRTRDLLFGLVLELCRYGLGDGLRRMRKANTDRAGLHG